MAYFLKIIIGENCQIAPRVSFETSNHGLIYKKNKGRGTFTKPIIVEDEVWIGANAVLTAGVRIGKHSVVAGGSVVTKDVPAYTVVGGNPARILKQYHQGSGQWLRPDDARLRNKEAV